MLQSKVWLSNEENPFQDAIICGNIQTKWKVVEVPNL